MMRIGTESILVAAGIAAIGAFFFWPGAETPPTVTVEAVDPSWEVSRDAAASLTDVLTLQAACLEAEFGGQAEAAVCQDLARLLDELVPEEAPAAVPAVPPLQNLAIGVPSTTPVAGEVAP